MKGQKAFTQSVSVSKRGNFDLSYRTNQAVPESEASNQIGDSMNVAFSPTSAQPSSALISYRRPSDMSAAYDEEYGIPLKGDKFPTSMVPLGEGNYGSVYKCVSKSSGKEVAVKVVNLTKGTKEEYDEKSKEILTYQQHSHHNSIVQCYSWFINHQKTLIFMILEFCNKGTLADDINNRKPKMNRYNDDELKSFCVDILQGLGYLHQSERCHLDLKPENIGMKDEEFKINYKLLDLGLSHESGEFDDLIIGTRSFMAPEIVFGAKDRKINDTKVDIFSFGCVLYEVMFFENLFLSLTAGATTTGDNKTSKNELSRLFYDQIAQGIPFPSHNYPEMYTKIIVSCLKENPNERPTARDLLQLFGENPNQVLRVMEGKLVVPKKLNPEMLGHLDSVPDIRLSTQSLKNLIHFAAESQRKIEMINRQDYIGVDNLVTIKETKDWFYSGQYNAKTLQKQGFGVLFDRNTKDLYFGFFDKDKKNGFGIMVYSEDAGERFFPKCVPHYYVGDYCDDKMKSFSALITFRQNQMKFCGRIEDDVICSLGTLTYYKDNHFCKFFTIFSNGKQGEVCDLLIRSFKSYESHYHGSFIDQQIVKGTMIDSRKRKFEGGEWKSLTSGRGIIIDQQLGTKYVGHWVDLMMNGKGILTKEGEFCYEGEFSNDLYEGQGTFTNFKENTITTAQFKQGLENGKGNTVSRPTQQAEKGWSYEGDYEAGSFHGIGKMANGKQNWVYEGTFTWHKITGKGKRTFFEHPTLISFEGDFDDGQEKTGRLEYKNGDIYIGAVKVMPPTPGSSHDQPYQLVKHGKGKLDYKSHPQYFQYDGEWQNDKFFGSGNLYEKNGCYYEGNFHNGLPEGKGQYIKYSGTQATTMRGIFSQGLFKRGEIKYPDGAYYIGEVDKDQQKSGQGVLKYKNGDMYNGQFENDNLHGMGLMNYADPADHLYYGEFVKGKQEGIGELRTDFIEYYGSFKNNQRHGNGIIIFKKSPDFAQYEGEFKHNWIHGKGVLSYKNGSKLEGNFVSKNVDKHEHDQSIYKYLGELLRTDVNFQFATLKEFHPRSPDTWITKYEGPIKHGYMHSENIKQPLNAKLPKLESKVHKFVYEGGFKEGKPHGQGEFKYDDGTTFVGRMREGDKDQGKFTFTNGDLYDGSFAQGLPSGQGTLTYKNNDRFVKYIGAFIKGQLHGPGEMYMQDGRRFEGVFCEGSQKSGLGTMELRNPTTKEHIRFVGNFEKFQLNGQGEYFEFKTLNYYKGPFLNSKFQTEEGQEGTFYYNVMEKPHKQPNLEKSNIRWYRGEFIFGKFTGRGVFHYNDQYEYKGLVCDGKRHGEGELHDKHTGNIFKGKWTNDKLDNKSALQYGSDPEKVVYTGEFENVKDPDCHYLPVPRGSGCVKMKDGSDYVGDMYKGLREGAGRIMKGSTVVYDGYFKADKPTK